MSAEIYGSRNRDQDIISTAGTTVGDILVATGNRPDLAYTIGSRAGEYAAGLIMSALRERGTSLVDEEWIAAAVEVIGDCTANPTHVDFYEEASAHSLTAEDFSGFVVDARSVDG
ncbi:hypothetical protein KC973_01950 [Candidatus Saccharibacteria bacterium]|nr:hypothetical protein [Candidatus Saccharibacteria bacterium]